MDRIEEIRARVEKASKGPWTTEDGHYPCFKDIKGPSFNISVVTYASDLDSDDIRKRLDDIDFIFHAREDIPYLLTALAEKDKRIEEATSQVISLLAKTGGVEYRNRLEAILAALGKEG